MKKTIILLMLVTFAIALFAADDLEMILSGNASTDHFVVKDNSSNTLFMVKGHGVVNIPTLSSAPSSPAEGDMYTNSSTHEIYYYDGSSWTSLLATGETDPTLTDDGDVTIGDNSTNPVKLTFDGTTDADIFYETSLQILNFEIGSHNVLQTISNSGIISFTKQSRARAYQDYELNSTIHGGQLIPNNTWRCIAFDTENYDQQNEFTTGSLAPTYNPAYFTATESGYYQVNSRIDFLLTDDQGNPIHNPSYPGFVSIAIFSGVPQASGNPLTGTMIAQGNCLQGADNNSGWNDMQNNLAPNISDVVFLTAGQSIYIAAYQNLYNNGLMLKLRGVTDSNSVYGDHTSQIYVSIHKVS